MTITPLGDRAWLIAVAAVPDEAATARVGHVVEAVRNPAIPGVRECVAGLTDVAVYLDERVDGGDVRAALEVRTAELGPAGSTVPALPGRERHVPVLYGGDAGPDLPDVARQAGLSEEAVRRLHGGGRYWVQAIGFLPGFPYLGGLAPELQTARRATPRVRVPLGAVGIGGRQTGIYSVESPGGWNLIGRTPQPLFTPTAEVPAWLQAGDRVTFQSIDSATFQKLCGEADGTRRAQAAADTEPRAPLGVEVLQPGVQTTVQDLGRHGWQAQGVPVGGAADRESLCVANLLVGNSPDAAGLEWALRGPVLRFLEERVVAVTGDPLGGGDRAWRPRRVGAGEVLDLREACRGLRGYLAIAGGIEVPSVLGSRSTCLLGRFGGWHGRALQAGDRLPVGEPRVTTVRAGWSVAPRSWPIGEPWVLHVVRGPQADAFSSFTWRVLTESVFTVRAESDRMALRLAGPPIRTEERLELTSAPVGLGAVQVPPDGAPVVLQADRQTMGGYPQIAYVISADWPKLAQLRPGDTLRWVEVTLAEADTLRRAQQKDLALLQLGVAAALKA